MVFIREEEICQPNDRPDQFYSAGARKGSPLEPPGCCPCEHGSPFGDSRGLYDRPLEKIVARFLGYGYQSRRSHRHGIGVVQALLRCVLWISSTEQDSGSASRVITLDSQMAQRLESKAHLHNGQSLSPLGRTRIGSGKAGRAAEHSEREHGVEGKFVVMYSGNHSRVHPLDTILGAARSLAAERIYYFYLLGAELKKRRLRRP